MRSERYPWHGRFTDFTALAKIERLKDHYLKENRPNNFLFDKPRVFRDTETDFQIDQ